MSDGSGRLPEGWVEAKLGDLGEWIGGGTPSKANPKFWEAGTIPWVSPKDMKQPELRESEDRITQSAIAASATCLLPADSVLVVTRSGILQRTVPVAIARVPVAVNQDLKALLPSAAILPEYVASYIRATEQEILTKCSKAGTTVASIDFSRLKEFPVRFPPLPEQRRIVARIRELQARTARAREALQSVPTLLEQLRQSVLASAFRGDLTADWRENHPDVEPASVLLERIRVERRRRWEAAELEKMRAKGKEPRDDRWKEKYEEPEPVNSSGLPELPEGWAWARWEEVGFSQNGRAFPSSEYRETGVRLLRPGNLHISGSVEWTEETTRFMAEEWAARYPTHLVGPNELVMNLTAQSLKDEFLGRICLTGEDERCLLNQRIARLTPVELSSQFCLLLFKSPVFRRFVDGLNKGSLIQHMFTSQVNGFAFPLPPCEEQSLIVARVQKALRFNEGVAAVVSDNTDAANNLDRSVLARAFRGELVPQDPSDEPARVLLERIRQEREQQRHRGRNS